MLKLINVTAKLASCNFSTKKIYIHKIETMPWDHRGIKQFEAQKFVDILTNLKDAPSSQPFVVLDVRDLHEHEIESLSKMMSVEKLKANFPLIKLPLMDLLQDVTEDIPKKKTIVCICTNGLRSGRAMQYLEMKGFASAMVEGGLINISKCLPSANKPSDKETAKKLEIQKPEALPNSQQPKGKANIFNTILNKIK